MKVTAFIRKTAKKNDVSSVATIYFRLRDGKKDIKTASELTINPNHWSAEKQGYKDRVALVQESDKLALNNHIRNIVSLINANYTSEADSDWLSETLERYHHPQRFKTEEEIAAETKPLFIPLFDEFLEKHKLSEVRKKNYRVVKRGLQRYELYVRATKRGQKKFVLNVDDVTSDMLRDIWDFFENEYVYCEEYPAIYESIPEARTPQPRGRNTLLDCFSRIRTFFYWCKDNKRTTNTPFDDFPLEECTYGTPYYITIDERNKIYHTNLSRHPQLAIQRDIFVFQCLIGCRVGDLIKMTKSCIINGAIEYIPRKTKEGRPLTVRVPLNDTALEIVERYKQCEGDKLLPFISEQKYNVSIKRIFKAAGLKRLVTVINPTTREEEKKVLYEIASSHLARRTFVGNLYKQVKDPNLVGALSGHKEGSRAFARYREIDEEMKKELVNLLS
ncbi:site-specific integrase [Alistipes communis]|uniref:site-specific integrase n=1 Tax=Alistipes communis TaxID=2585118 RepID=UPI003076E1FF